MPRYMLEDSPYKKLDKKTIKLIRDFPEEKRIIERYDYHFKKWVPDVEMARVYFGSIEVDNISEEEANRLIEEVYDKD